MRKIMFNDRYGLTQAVLDGRKTQTRRIIPNCTGVRQSIFSRSGIEDNHGYELKPKYHVGEVVAVAQSYKDINLHVLTNACIDKGMSKKEFADMMTHHAGRNNKLFVSAALMPHRIRITDVRVERLNDISESDCQAEGIVAWTKDEKLYKYDLKDVEMFPWSEKPHTPREAYAALIDKISGKGTWDSNPYVFAYTFELVK